MTGVIFDQADSVTYEIHLSSKIVISFSYSSGQFLPVASVLAPNTPDSYMAQEGTSVNTFCISTHRCEGNLFYLAGNHGVRQPSRLCRIRRPLLMYEVSRVTPQQGRIQGLSEATS